MSDVNSTIYSPQPNINESDITGRLHACDVIVNRIKYLLFSNDSDELSKNLEELQKNLNWLISNTLTVEQLQRWDETFAKYYALFK